MDTAEVTNALLREISTRDVLDLSPDFYERAAKLLETLREKGERDLFARYEATLLQRTLEKLFLIRVEKIVTHMLRTGRKPEAKLPREEIEVVRALERALGAVRGEVTIQETLAEVQPVSKGRVKVRDGVLVMFLKPYSKIMLEQGIALGPFSRGDLAYLPRNLAKELSEKGVVELFEELSRR